MLEIGTSGLMSGEGKRVVIGLYTSELIPRLSSTLPNFVLRPGLEVSGLCPVGILRNKPNLGGESGCGAFWRNEANLACDRG